MMMNILSVATATFLMIGSASSFSVMPLSSRPSMALAADPWEGQVVPDESGKIQGCSIQSVGGSLTEFIVTIDGVEGDLGRFSEAIYKKVTSDAKKQRFQGFRPGTIPPHLEPTYRAFAMDECARETILEAMEQNSLRPFSEARNEMTIGQVSIPPPVLKATKKKSKKRKKGVPAAEASEPEAPPEEPKWLTFDNMKGAIDAGWKPGQSFSFIAENVKGQRVLNDEATKGATPIGLNY